MSPPVVAFGRIVLGAAVLLPVAAKAGALRGARPLLGILALVALVQVAGPFLLIAEGQEHVNSSLAGILVASAPIFTAILAIAYDPEERSEGLRGVGVVLGIVGVAALLGLDLGGGDALAGGLMIVAASLGYAIGGLLVKRRLGGLEPLGVAALVLAISTVFSAPVALLSAPDEVPGLGPLAAVAALGVIGTGAAFAIFYGLISRVGPARAFVVTYLAPGFAVVYGVLLLDESISVATIGGLALILGGSYLAAEGRFPWQRRPDIAELIDADPAAGGLDPRTPEGERIPG